MTDDQRDQPDQRDLSEWLFQRRRPRRRRGTWTTNSTDREERE